jgi:hypothetical protein
MFMNSASVRSRYEVGLWLVTKRIESLVEREIVAAAARHGFAALSERKS